jgi:hypothetical protein
MHDYVRAAMTCIRFYQKGARNYSDLASNLEHLHRAQSHLENELLTTRWQTSTRSSSGIIYYNLSITVDVFKVFFRMLFKYSWMMSLIGDFSVCSCFNAFFEKRSWMACLSIHVLPPKYRSGYDNLFGIEIYNRSCLMIVFCPYLLLYVKLKLNVYNFHQQW